MQFRVRPTAALGFLTDFEDVNIERVLEPSGDEAPMAPLFAGRRRFPAQERRNLAIGRRLQLGDDVARIEWREDLGRVKLDILLWRHAIEPRPRIEFWVASKSRLATWDAARDANTGI